MNLDCIFRHSSLHFQHVMSCLSTITELATYFNYFPDDTLVRIFGRVLEYNPHKRLLIVQELEQLFSKTDIPNYSCQKAAPLTYKTFENETNLKDTDSSGQKSTSLGSFNLTSSYSLPLAFINLLFTNDDSIEQTVPFKLITDAEEYSKEKLVVEIVGKIVGTGYLTKPACNTTNENDIQSDSTNSTKVNSESGLIDLTIASPVGLPVKNSFDPKPQHQSSNNAHPTHSKDKIPVLKMTFFSISPLDNQDFFENQTCTESVLKMAIMNRENARIKKIKLLALVR